jgi:hypothetical protein
MGEDLFSKPVTIGFSRQTLLHGPGLEKFETIVLILHHTAFGEEGGICQVSFVYPVL